MNVVERALVKQRLLIASATQRATLARYADGLKPLFTTADRLHAGARWAERHPEFVAAGVAVLAASSSATRRFLWRWSRRGFVAWRIWRDGRRWIDAPATRS